MTKSEAETIAELTATVAELRELVKEHELSFDLRWKAMMRATQMWQKETGQHLTLPDHADLCMWLLRRLENYERVPDPGKVYEVEYDGFRGRIIGDYVTHEGKAGAVLQQEGTRVVHVYRLDRLTARDDG